MSFSSLQPGSEEPLLLEEGAAGGLRLVAELATTRALYAATGNSTPAEYRYQVRARVRVTARVRVRVSTPAEYRNQVATRAEWRRNATLLVYTVLTGDYDAAAPEGRLRGWERFRHILLTDAGGISSGPGAGMSSGAGAGLDAWRRIVRMIDKGLPLRLEELRGEVRLLHTKPIKDLESVAAGIGPGQAQG